MVTLLAVGGLNRSRLSLSALDDLPQIIRLWLVGAASLVVISEFVTGSMQLVLLFGVLPAILFMRVVLYGLVRYWRTKGSVTHPTVVVGSGSLGQIVADALARHPDSGLRAVGFVDSRTLEVEPPSIPLLGEPSELSSALVTSRARAVIVAHGDITDAELVSMVRKCQRQQCEVFVLPAVVRGDPRRRRHGRRRRSAAHPAAPVGVPEPVVADQAGAGRRGVGVGDRAAVAAAGPRRSRCGWRPVRHVFRQQRVGRDGESFEVIKFRGSGRPTPTSPTPPGTSRTTSG